MRNWRRRGQHERDARAHIGFNLGQRLGVQPRMLANVESRKMKSKGPHLAQQRINHQLGQSLAAVYRQAFADQQKVAFEFFGRWVGLYRAKPLAAMAQTNDDQVEQPAIKF